MISKCASAPSQFRRQISFLGAQEEAVEVTVMSGDRASSHLAHHATHEHLPVRVDRELQPRGALHGLALVHAHATGTGAPVASIQPPRLAHAEPVAGSSRTAPERKKNRATTVSADSRAHT